MQTSEDDDYIAFEGVRIRCRDHWTPEQHEAHAAMVKLAVERIMEKQAEVVFPADENN